MLLIVSESRAQAQYAAEWLGLRKEQWQYISEAYQLDGLSHDARILRWFGPGAFTRPRIQDIIARATLDRIPVFELSDWPARQAAQFRSERRNHD